MKIFVPDRFSVIRVLREDSASKTFLANDHALERNEVLVKIIRKGYFKRDRNRLIRQLSWFAGIRHSNLSVIFDAGLTTKADLYCVREYLPISELFSADGFSVTKALVSAVDFLRSQGRAHGAIKPSNIFLNSGLVKLTDPNLDTIQLRDLEENIRFFAPEVLRGQNPTLESDLYSLGAVLYRVLARRNLFEDLNLSHLRAKYVWASPLSIGNLCNLPKPVSDAVIQLLDKDPQKRIPAFASLKERIAAEPTIPIRAPFVGREDLLRETIEFLRQQSTRGLRVLLIEGAPGIGKSRFIEELRIHCAFEELLFLTSACVADSSEFRPILGGIHKLWANINSSQRNRHGDLGALPNEVAECLRPGGEIKRNYPVEKLTNELVRLLGSFARQMRLVLAIEDIDKADSATLRFIEQLSFRAAEAPLSLVLTHRYSQSDVKLSATLSECIAEDFHRVRLLPLTPPESQRLVGYLERSPEKHATLLRMSGGNPLFIEEQARYSTDKSITTNRGDEALDWMTAQITKETRPLAETLSVLRKPVELETIAKISARNIVDLQQQLKTLENAGVIERDGLAIRIAYPALAGRVYRIISSRNRSDLAARTYDVLRMTSQESEDLAYYSFAAARFNEASSLYQQLARAAHGQQKYQDALAYYQGVRQCELRGGSQFLPQDKLNLARCYIYTGRPKQTRVVCEDLLSDDAVRNNPEFLSEVYVRLASGYDKTSTKERIRLSRLAIECLPPNSPKLCFRYVTLCSRLLEGGDLSAAIVALERAKECAVSDKDTTPVNLARGIVLINMADFRQAAEALLKVDLRHTDSAIVFTNLALCFENLGDLRKALQFQSQAQKLAIANGISHIQILSLNNLGSIKTKLGETSEAGQLFENALLSFNQLRKKETAFDMAKFLTLHCDAALHSLQLGKYGRAANYLRDIRLLAGSVYEIDRVFCGVAQCFFYLGMGFAKKVRPLLVQLNNSQTFKTPFFRVEQALLDARMPDVSTENKLQCLQEALETTQRLGTLYQQCQVLNELAAVHISVNEKRKALEYSKRALRLAHRQSYRLLAARGMLLAGVADDTQSRKERKLFAAFRSASEMGLSELVAESAFYIGTLHLESGNFVTAREYLVRSVSITEKVAEEIPVRYRANYLAVSWRREAGKSLERCNLTMRQRHTDMIFDGHEPLGDDRYFKAAYRLALSAAAIKSAEALITSIEETLRTSLAHGAVILLKTLSGLITSGVRLKLSEEVIRRVHDTAAMARNRIYFGLADMARQRETVAWIPLQSETREGGIYVLCRQSEAPLTEKEMELLAIIGTIGNGSLRGLETSHASEIENTPLDEFYGIIGASKAIREIYSQIQIASRNAATVLIEGESGTGKELVAKAIHAAGPRAKESFIAVDCGAIPEGLIEAELFGAKRGSYTGAVADRSGLFEAAHRGTIFLDEISNTTPALQAKLLRVIQEREVRRIGDTKDRPIDVRLIVASNTNLETLVNEGRFRKDLLYRLKVLHIKVPPLRGRREDIPMLAHAFLKKLNAANKLKKYFAPGIVDRLTAENFPGNVRELQNAIERAFFTAKGSVISDVPLETLGVTTATHDEVQSWFKDLSEGRKDFWSAIHNRYKRRDISREKVLALVDLGLRSSRGSYKTLASKFHLKSRDYRRFMDFLRRNECLLDFRPYRKAADDAQ